MTSTAVSNKPNLASAPVIQELQALNTNISGVDLLLPIGQCHSFARASQILVGRNGVGKSALMHMIYSSIRNNNYFEEHQCSSFVEDFRRYPELLTKLTKGQLGLKDRNLVANFCLENSCNFVFLTHLEQIDPLVAKAIREGKSFLLKPKILQSLFNNLTKDSPLNRYFYLGLKTDSLAVYPIYQATVTPKDSTKNIKDPIEMGAFNHHFDGLNLSGAESLKHSKFSQGIQLDSFSFTQGKDRIDFREQALSSGQSAFFDWQITCQKIERFFSEQVITFPCNKTFADRGFVHLEVGQEVSYPIPKDSKLILIIDEPTSFLDWESADRFTEQLVTILNKYSGRIQLILSTHDRTLLKDLAPYSEYLNFMQTPSVLQLDCPRKKN